MTKYRDPDVLIQAFLEDGITELPDRSYDVVRAAIEDTRQRVVIGPWREEQMTRLAIFGVAVAAVVLVAVVAINFLPRGGGIGGPPPATATPTAAPTASPTTPPTLSPTPIADPDTGRLAAGTYVAHPFAPPNDALSFTFTVPSDSWEGHHSDPGEGGMFGIAQYGDAEGLGMGFLRVASLNADPCQWLGTEDVQIGTTVDDLVAALTATSDDLVDALRYDLSEPSDVSLGGYAGKQVVVTMPSLSGRHADYSNECDEDAFRIWNAEGFTAYAQGPENRWRLWILDVEGERAVILMSDFEDSRPERVQELQSIVDSIEITAP